MSQREKEDLSSSSSEDEDVFDTSDDTDEPKQNRHESHNTADDTNEPQQNRHEAHNKPNRKTLIISTSITKGINPTRFNNCYEDGRAWFARKHGWKVKQIKEDVHLNLRQGDCDDVIVQIGGNDIQDLFKDDMITKKAVEIIETAHI